MATNSQPAQTIKACAYIDKGGVGKTTTIAHFGVALAQEGKQVLLIDLAGKQGDLAKQFGLTEEIAAHDDWPNISTVFQPEWPDIVKKYREQFDADAAGELIYATDEGVDLIPAHPGLDSLEVELDNKFTDARKFTRLDQFLEEHIDPQYDVVLIDLPGAANNISYNGIFATHHVITPVQAGSFESKQADALVDDLAVMKREHGADVDLTMLVPNMIDTRTKLASEYLTAYEDRFGTALAPLPIPNSQDIANAQDVGQTIFALEEPSKTARRAIDAYEENARELAHRIDTNNTNTNINTNTNVNTKTNTKTTPNND